MLRMGLQTLKCAWGIVGMADEEVSKTSVTRRVSSSLTSPTIFREKEEIDFHW